MGVRGNECGGNIDSKIIIELVLVVDICLDIVEMLFLGCCVGFELVVNDCWIRVLVVCLMWVDV